MKRDMIIPFCLGIALGAVTVLAVIWVWQIITGNLGIVAVLITVIIAAAVFFICQLWSWKAVSKAKKSHADELKKYYSYYKLIASWMKLRIEGKKISEYFENNGLKNVAIYGLGRLGKCLYDELKDSTVNVAYGIDMDAVHFSYLNLKVLSTESKMEDADAIIVTLICEYESIAEKLREKMKCKIISLEDIISSL